MGDMVKVVPCVIYAAKSTQDRHKSIETQIEDCRKMAEREGWEVIGEFKDEGFSAYSGNRGRGLAKAKEVATKAAAERRCMLVAQHSDRFARGAGDRPGAADSLVEIWHAMRRKDVHLRTVQNDAMMSDPLLVAAAAKLSYEESKRKSAAVKSGKRRRAQDRKQANGPVPFGYRLVASEDDERKKRVPDPGKDDAFRHMSEMLGSGDGSARSPAGSTIKASRRTWRNAFGRGRVANARESLLCREDPARRGPIDGATRRWSRGTTSSGSTDA